jgi:integrase
MASVYKRNGGRHYLASFRDAEGKRVTRSTKTPDHKAGVRIANEWEAQARLRQEGVIDLSQDRYSTEGRRPIAEHVADYLNACEHSGQAAKNIAEKRRHLERLIKETGATRLSDVRTDTLVANMAGMTVRAVVGRDEQGQLIRESKPASARSKNFRRQAWMAFFNWLVKVQRIERNPLAFTPKLDERNDRRRVRRSLTDDELVRLIQIARQRDEELNANPSYPHGRSSRAAFYLAAALAGLRRGDLERLRWRDVDFEGGTITIRDGKAKRTDSIPLHPQLAEEFLSIRPTSVVPNALATRRVFEAPPTSRTCRLDFERAGIGPDAEGREADLHALRTTLGTRLARAGVTPQVAQRLMRHADYKTTLAHYTVLGLIDTRAAVEAIPAIVAPPAAVATGGTDSASVSALSTSPCIPVHPGASSSGSLCGALGGGSALGSGVPARSCGTVHSGAEKRVTGIEPATFSLGS